MIRVLAVGKMKSPYLDQGTRDFTRRIQRFAKLELVEIADRNPAWEGERIVEKLRGQPVVACDLSGEDWSSQDMSRFLGQHGGPSFVLGGPDGLSQAVLERAHRRLRLSAMTFPHELARLILLEQIYRGLSILNGHPYHR